MNPALLIAALALLVLYLVIRRTWGHRPRMWTLHDGTFMTGCGCGWAGSPRATREEAEQDMARHRDAGPASPEDGS